MGNIDMIARRCNRIASIVALTMMGLLPVHAGETIPVPALTIYPGDVIRDAMVANHDVVEGQAPIGFVTKRSALVGKVAKRTLLPGRAIPLNSIDDPKAVANGSRVKIIFEEGGLSISTYAIALQSGSIGDLIRVRNLDSGLTISGVVQADGSVRISDS
jgi:flagellar basal body P-ring formation protein FlgA